MYLAQMTGGGMLLDTKLVNTSGNCSVLPGTVYPWLLSGHLDFGGVCVAHLFSFLCCVCLRPVSCVPNVSSFSGCPCVVFVFVLCLVYPMFPVSLVAPVLCLSSSCVLCTQCFQFLWLPLCCACLRPVSCVPNVSSFSGCPCVVLVFVLCHVYPMFPVSLVAPVLCLSSFCVLCTQCFQFLWLPLCCVCLRPVSCVPNVSSFSGCPCVVLVFVLCLVYPMFPVSLVAPVLCLSSSCVPNVSSFSGCPCVVLVFVLCLVYPLFPVSLVAPVLCLSSSCVLCTQCFQFFWLPLCCACLRPVSCVPNVSSFSGCPCVVLVFVLCLVYPMFPVSLVAPVFCVMLVFVLCLVYPMFPVSLVATVLCLSSSCVLCTQCFQFLWLPLCCACLRLVYPLFPVSLVAPELCLSSSCVLCTQCFQFLWLPLLFSLTFIWFNDFRREDINVIFYQNMPILHNQYKSAE